MTSGPQYSGFTLQPPFETNASEVVDYQSVFESNKTLRFVDSIEKGVQQTKKSAAEHTLSYSASFHLGVGKLLTGAIVNMLVGSAEAHRTLSPVLVLGFNRPNLLRRVLEVLQSAGARRIYVSLDGPRERNAGDAKLCAEAALIVARSTVTDVSRVRVSPGNLGCRLGVATGISWFFEQERQGIILEDDCIPNDSFLRFCDQMLEQYRDHPDVGHISGTRFFAEKSSPDSPAFFSRFASVWGWATWKDRWAYFEELNGSLALKVDKKAISVVSKTPGFYRFWRKQLDGIFHGLIDTWDYLWQYSLWTRGKLAIVPPVNLVENQGFGTGAAHTHRRPVSTAFHPASRRLSVSMPIEVDEKIQPENEGKTLWLLLPILGSPTRTALRIAWVFFRRFE